MNRIFLELSGTLTTTTPGQEPVSIVSRTWTKFSIKCLTLKTKASLGPVNWSIVNHKKVATNSPTLDKLKLVNLSTLQNAPKNSVFNSVYRKFNDDRETISSGPPPANPNSRKSKIDVFGRELSEVCRETDKQVPEIVTFSIKKIEAIGITDGIYRISGRLTSYYLK